jgi:hypothetical protein
MVTLHSKDQVTLSSLGWWVESLLSDNYIVCHIVFQRPGDPNKLRAMGGISLEWELL